MTDMQTWQPTGAVATMAAGVVSLAEWAAEADAAYALAQRLCGTAFCPQAFRGKPQEGAAAILAGKEVGLSPLAALGAFDVIQGRTAPRAITLRALVQSKGHEVVLVESTATRCKMRGRRATSSTWQEIVWTIDRAKGLELLGKDQWKKQPQTMLVARATSELCRLIAADAILGISDGGLSLEEVQDGVTVTASATDMPAAESGPRVMSRKRPAPTPEPEPEGLPAADGITTAQSRKMHALFRELGRDRDAALAYCAGVLDRDVDTTKTLTKAEASQVIDNLTADAAEAEVADADPSDGWEPQP